MLLIIILSLFKIILYCNKNKKYNKNYLFFYNLLYKNIIKIKK